MATIRKLTEDEVRAIESDTGKAKATGVRAAKAAEYDAYVADADVGSFFAFDLEEGENRLTVKNRIHAALTRKGFGTRFIRTKGNTVRVEVVSKELGAAADGESIAE